MTGRQSRAGFLASQTNDLLSLMTGGRLWLAWGDEEEQRQLEAERLMPPVGSPLDYPVQGGQVGLALDDHHGGTIRLGSLWLVQQVYDRLRQVWESGLLYAGGGSPDHAPQADRNVWPVLVVLADFTTGPAMPPAPEWVDARAPH